MPLFLLMIVSYGQRVIPINYNSKFNGTAEFNDSAMFNANVRINGHLIISDGTQGTNKVFTSDASGNGTWQASTVTAWGLSGNAGTTAGTNFIGTTDSVDVLFQSFKNHLSPNHSYMKIYPDGKWDIYAKRGGGYADFHTGNYYDDLDFGGVQGSFARYTHYKSEINNQGDALFIDILDTTSQYVSSIYISQPYNGINLRNGLLNKSQSNSGLMFSLADTNALYLRAKSTIWWQITRSSGMEVNRATKFDSTVTIYGTTTLGEKTFLKADTTGVLYGRIVPRWFTVVNTATPSVNTDKYDCYEITALTTDITNFTATGTPTNFQKLYVRIIPDATAHAITWDATKFSSGIVTLPATTVASKTLSVFFIYDSNISRWVCQSAGSYQ